MLLFCLRQLRQVAALARGLGEKVGAAAPPEAEQLEAHEAEAASYIVR